MYVYANLTIWRLECASNQSGPVLINISVFLYNIPVLCLIKYHETFHNTIDILLIINNTGPTINITDILIDNQEI